MATAAVAARYPHIMKTEGVRCGSARIEGTRVTVRDIVVLQGWGMKLEEMLEHYSDRPLTLAEVHAALAYYHDNKDEIDEEFAEGSRYAAEYEQRKAEYLATRSK